MTTINRFGLDIHCIDDIDPSLSIVSGYQCLGEAAARRISTPRRGLWYDPEYGYDARNFLNRPFTETQMASPVENEVVKDERIQNATADIKYTPIGGTPIGDTPEELSITLLLETADGAFTYTLLLGSSTISAEMLKGQF